MILFLSVQCLWSNKKYCDGPRRKQKYASFLLFNPIRLIHWNNSIHCSILYILVCVAQYFFQESARTYTIFTHFGIWMLRIKKIWKCFLQGAYIIGDELRKEVCDQILVDQRSLVPNVILGKGKTLFGILSMQGLWFWCERSNSKHCSQSTTRKYQINVIILAQEQMFNW